MIKPISIRVNILTHFILVSSIIVVLLLFLQVYFSMQLALSAAEKSFQQTSKTISQYIKSADQRSKDKLYSLERSDLVRQFELGNGQETALMKRFASNLEQTISSYAIYIGFENGDFFEIINMVRDPDLFSHYKAPKETRWISITVAAGTDGSRVQDFKYFTDEFILITERQQTTDYQANMRPWFIQAKESESAMRTDPYLFANLGEMGITFSKEVQGSGDRVLGIDVTLTNLDQFLREQRFEESSEIFMFGQNGKIIAGSTNHDSGERTDNYLKDIFFSGKIDHILRYKDEVRDKFLLITELTEESGNTTYLGLTVDTAVMLRPYYQKIYISLAFSIGVIFLIIPLIIYMTRNIVRPIRALMTENAKIQQRKFDGVGAIETNISEFKDLSESLLGMAESIQRYQRSQAELMDSFIRLIADAIDAKSAYTGGHCKRVPEIATMLVKVAHNQEEGVFKDFRFSNDDAWREFEIGAWMHDCGKVTTPEYVVDKATKLETIYNRIHEIRTRFEVIWRDVEIISYQRLAKGDNETEVQLWKETSQQELLDDFQFIAQCNVGGEYMSQERQERVREIGSRRWIRHFSNRVGLSEAEMMRYEGIDEASLPVEERLLDDKVEHIVPRVDFDREGFAQQGFKMEVPEHLYNYGELYNLCIEKGTLTTEERFKINEHVIMTIRMLEHLPYPDGMEQIPEYAGTHHETMIGTGYPRKLSKNDLSLPARVMVVADVFEALTASDRPYKKGKKISEALKIMSFMCKDEHLDKELFELFLHSGIYKEYGKKYLREDQLDEVDVTTLI